MTAINRNMIKIAIAAAGTDASSLVDTDYIKGEIKSYDKSGGEKDVESVPHFGGDVDKKKPRGQYELSFEVTPSIEDSTRWEKLAYGSTEVNGNIAYLSNLNPDDKSVFIHASKDSNDITWGFDNCEVTVLDMEHDAEDNMTKNLTLKFSSEDGDGRANYAAIKVAPTDFPSWHQLPNGS